MIRELRDHDSMLELAYFGPQLVKLEEEEEQRRDALSTAEREAEDAIMEVRRRAVDGEDDEEDEEDEEDSE